MDSDTLKASLGESVGGDLRAMGKGIERGLRDGTPSDPLLGLPLARVIPQDVHSVLDYAGGVSYGLSALFADRTAAKAVGFSLCVGVVGASLLTDYRLSVAKVIPIEVHESLDFITGATACVAPFAFGYWKKDPVAAITHLAVGLTVIVGSLLTDYRAYRGTKWRAR
jgi:hypothetical protein